MSGLDLFLLAGVLVCVLLAVRSVRRGKVGGCCGSCGSCSHRCRAASSRRDGRNAENGSG